MKIRLFDVLERPLMAWCIAAALVSLGYLVLIKINHRDQMADYQVYYGSARALIEGQQVYGQWHYIDSGVYKYAPITLWSFVPLALLPYPVSSVVFYLLNVLLLLWCGVKVFKLVQGIFPVFRLWHWLPLAAASLFLSDHFIREMHLGNVNLLLLLLSVLAFEATLHNAWKRAGVFLALALLFKPHFAILLPWFVLSGRWRVALWAVGVFLAGLFVPAFVWGFQFNQELIGGWWHSMMIHNESPLLSGNTIYYILNAFIGVDAKSAMASFLIMSCLGAVALGFLWLMYINRKTKGSSLQSAFIEYFILIALIPNLVPTDTEHFMWCWPVLCVALGGLSILPQPQKLFSALLMFAAFVPFALSTPDLVGAHATQVMDEGGLLGLANMLIIAVGLVVFNRLKSITSPAGLAL